MYPNDFFDFLNKIKEIDEQLYLNIMESQYVKRHLYLQSEHSAGLNSSPEKILGFIRLLRQLNVKNLTQITLYAFNSENLSSSAIDFENLTEDELIRFKFFANYFDRYVEDANDFPEFSIEFFLSDFILAGDFLMEYDNAIDNLHAIRIFLEKNEARITPSLLIAIFTSKNWRAINNLPIGSISFDEVYDPDNVDEDDINHQLWILKSFCFHAILSTNQPKEMVSILIQMIEKIEFEDNDDFHDLESMLDVLLDIDDIKPMADALDNVSSIDSPSAGWEEIINLMINAAYDNNNSELFNFLREINHTERGVPFRLTDLLHTVLQIQNHDQLIEGYHLLHDILSRHEHAMELFNIFIGHENPYIAAQLIRIYQIAHDTDLSDLADLRTMMDAYLDVDEKYIAALSIMVNMNALTEDIYQQIDDMIFSDEHEKNNDEIILDEICDALCAIDSGKLREICDAGIGLLVYEMIDSSVRKKVHPEAIYTVINRLPEGLSAHKSFVDKIFKNPEPKFLETLLSYIALRIISDPDFQLDVYEMHYFATHNDIEELFSTFSTLALYTDTLPYKLQDEFYLSILREKLSLSATTYYLDIFNCLHEMTTFDFQSAEYLHLIANHVGDIQFLNVLNTLSESGIKLSEEQLSEILRSKSLTMESANRIIRTTPNVMGGFGEYKSGAETESASHESMNYLYNERQSRAVSRETNQSSSTHRERSRSRDERRAESDDDANPKSYSGRNTNKKNK